MILNPGQKEPNQPLSPWPPALHTPLTPTVAFPTWGRWSSLRGQAQWASGARHRGQRWQQGQEQRGGRACKRACQRLPVIPAPPPSGWAETHMAGGSWHHRTGTWWGWAKRGLVEVARREEAPGKNRGSVPAALHPTTRLVPTSPVLISTPGHYSVPGTVRSAQHMNSFDPTFKTALFGGHRITPLLQLRKPGSERRHDSPRSPS